MLEHYKNSYKVTEKELISLSVYNVGFQKCDSLYQWGPGIRDHYLIHHIISGCGHYVVNGISYSLKTGDTFLVYPNVEVIYYADKEYPWEYAWVGFSGTDAPNILHATDFSSDSPVITDTPDGRSIYERILKIYDLRGNEFENALKMTSQLYTMLSIFVRNASHHEIQNNFNSYVQKGIEYINANYSYAITVNDIANYVGLSRSHLFRSFENILGRSPKEYLTDFRMEQAKYLLENSNLSITAIANSVGFDNSLYFSKSFHKAFGMSPRDFRKDVLNEDI